jgi:hypothetical protein
VAAKRRVTKGARDENALVLAYLLAGIGGLEEEARAAGEVAGLRPELAGVLAAAQRSASAKVEAYRELHRAFGAGDHRKADVP